jgi:hypothetical protein
VNEALRGTLLFDVCKGEGGNIVDEVRKEDGGREEDDLKREGNDCEDEFRNGEEVEVGDEVNLADTLGDDDWGEEEKVVEVETRSDLKEVRLTVVHGAELEGDCEEEDSVY